MMGHENIRAEETTKETASQYVLADLDRLTIWGFYSSLDAALADQMRVNEQESSGDRQCHYKPMSFEEYAAHERKTYLSRPLKEITKAQYWDALEVLPPKHFEQCAGFESFLMIEHWSGSYTDQYVSFQGRYFSKLVDAFDRSTWLKPADLVTPMSKQEG